VRSLFHICDNNLAIGVQLVKWHQLTIKASREPVLLEDLRNEAVIEFLRKLLEGQPLLWVQILQNLENREAH
jgi:hypothetical protein